MKSRGLYIFVITASIICAIVVYEIIYYRFSCVNWHDPNTQFDPDLGWGPIPNRHIEDQWGGITSNSLGFRSEEINPAKGHVIVLGDSVAWGYGVGDNETMPYFLNRRLNAYNCQVSNLAVSGYGIDQYYLFLKRHIDKFENLKYVVLVICTDLDFDETINDTRYGKRKPLHVFKDGEIALSNVPIRKFDIRNLFSLSLTLNVLSKRFKAVDDFLNHISGAKTLDKEQGERLVRALLKRIYDITTERNAGLIVVTVPAENDFVEKTERLVWFQDYFLSKRDYARYIDFYDELKRSGEDTEELYVDPWHLGRDGNELLAASIFKGMILN
ncbi:MAG: SGNH/GDSL hydrolase family protein [Candidatus Omnitrophica bacterium]|nr:SGNH/GDSL hydrolase family protein [Candidatus Omnitrophota bacterium]